MRPTCHQAIWGRHLKCTLLLLVTLGGCAPLAARVALVEHGSTRYSIYHAATAPASVRLAAQELQYYLAKSTHVTLPIESGRAPRGACICLGDGTRARAAGVTGRPADDGYRILTHGNDVFIAGNDTRDHELTSTGGVSTGTLNGVYTFLDDYVGVRWLVPGDDGDYVPQHPTLLLQDIDRSDTPAFAERTLAYVHEERPEVRQWLQRQRQGGTLKYWHFHNWDTLVPASLYTQHPEWFALVAGRRQPPPGDRYKLETTDQHLREYFAARVVDSMRKDAGGYTFPISPTDGEDWSESSASRALYDRDPHGGLSITPLILDFYNDIARRVGRELPDRLVCGYLYAQYVFPPSGKPLPVDPHLCLVIAPHFSYGYALYYRPYRDDLLKILAYWSGATTQLGYYDLPNVWTRNEVNAPNAPGVELLHFLYPALAAAHLREVYVYGSPSFGQGALTNYLLAQLNWNPHADVAALAREFCSLAYGEAFGARVRSAFQKTDAAVAEFRARHPAYLDQITPQVLTEVYAPLVPDWSAVHRVGSATREAPGRARARAALLADLADFLRQIPVSRW